MGDTPPAPIKFPAGPEPDGSGPAADARRRKILDTYFERNGALKAVPARRAKRLAVLDWLAEDFRPGVRYPETEVNQILGRRFADFCLLRRLLVDEEMMQRRNRVYWRMGSVPNLGHDPAMAPDLEQLGG